MTLRGKTLIIIGLTIVSLILILYAVSRAILLHGFIDLEERYTHQDLKRALNALSDETVALDTMVFDWAAWDDTYDFIPTGDEAYIESNLVDETFTGARLNLVLYVNSSGQIVFGKGFDLHDLEEMSVPQSILEHLTADTLLLHHSDTESSAAGIVLLPEGPMLVASRPILTSREEGPIRGALIMGRYLDLTEVERLSKLTRLSLALYRFEDPWIPPDFQAVRSSLSVEVPIVVRPLGSESIAGYALVEDIYGEPGLVLRVDSPRDVYAQGRASMLYFVLSLLVVGLVMGTLVMLLLDRVVLSRLAQLGASVSSIGTSGDLSARVSMVGGDELSSLADAVNEMLAALERFQNDLREGEERYRLLFNSGNDAVFVSELMSDGMPGRLIEVNDVACQKTGYTREELLSLSAFDIVAPEDTSGFPALAEQFLVDESVLLEATGVGKDGKIIPVEVSVHLFDLSGKPAVLAIARDITERKQAEENLAAIYALGRELVLSRNRQRVAQTTVDAARLLLRCRLCGLWLVDEVERKLVCQAYTAGGQTVQKDALSLDGERGVIAAVARSGNPIYVPDERMDQRFIDAGLGTRSELCVPLRAGERIIGAINAESEKPDAFGEVEQRLLFMTLADQAALAIENAELYEQMRAGRDRLRTLSRRLVEVQETERRQIARELHDEIGQMLTGLKLVLEMSMRLPADTALSGMSEAQTLVNELLGRVRELSLDLRPAMLDDLGLLPSLLWHFERYTAQTDVQVVFKHTGLEGQHFASEVETAAYRIVQEALTNVARHADVSEAAVRVWADGETLGVQIEDQGAGFDPEDALAAGDSSGLSGMQERAVLLGGLLTIESNPGAGTTLTVELPLGASGEEEGARCA